MHSYSWLLWSARFRLSLSSAPPLLNNSQSLVQRIVWMGREADRAIRCKYLLFLKPTFLYFNFAFCGTFRYFIEPALGRATWWTRPVGGQSGPCFRSFRKYVSTILTYVIAWTTIIFRSTKEIQSCCWTWGCWNLLLLSTESQGCCCRWGECSCCPQRRYHQEE